METKQVNQNNVIPFNNPSSSASASSSTLPNLVLTPEEATQRIQALNEFVRSSMVKGVDYGLINGFSKPTLLKPGAEKLCDAFGFSKTVDVVNRIEQWETGIFSYEVKVTLANKETGVIEAEGIGSCNCKEAAYRYSDSFTIVNTLLKMAKKRALVDAVLSATRASGLFTQDIEDFPKENIKGGDVRATDIQLKTIFKLVEDLKIGNNVAKELMKVTYNVDRSTQLTKKQAYDFIQDLLLYQQSQREDYQYLNNESEKE